MLTSKTAVAKLGVASGNTAVIPFWIMKVAISLPDPLFNAADELAGHLHVSRSQLYAQALAEYLATREGALITQRLNAVYSGQAEGVAASLLAAQSRALDREAW